MNTPPDEPLEETSRPHIDPSIVDDDDDQALAEATDAIVLADVDARERMQEIFALTEALRASLDADTWRTFLRYDELANGRFSELLLSVARWAFREGRRHPVEGSS